MKVLPKRYASPSSTMLLLPLMWFWFWTGFCGNVNFLKACTAAEPGTTSTNQTQSVHLDSPTSVQEEEDDEKDEKEESRTRHASGTVNLKHKDLDFEKGRHHVDKDDESGLEYVENFDQSQCSPRQSSKDDTYDFDYRDVELPYESDQHPKYEEEFFSLLNDLNVDDWDVTLQQDADNNYHLLFERDDVLKTFPVPPIFNKLTEEEIIQLAVDYFDQQDEEWEETFKQEKLQQEESLSKSNTKSTPTVERESLRQARRRKEAKILSLFYEHIGGTVPLKNDGRWLSNTTVCNWYGVVCGPRGQHKAGVLRGRRNPTPPPDDAVTAIQLNNLDLDGTLPTELHMLDYLSQLILRNNNIRGTIPAQLAYASKLCVLDLSNNLMEGSIPALLSTKTRYMYQLHLNRNNFSGTLPRNMRAWKKLWLMDVSQNRFSGTIPNHIGIMTDLAIMSLGDNYLSGTLPTTIEALTNLKILDAGSNLLEGEIPTSLNKFTNLYDLNLGDNMLSGTFPRGIIDLKGLHTAYLSYNNFSGTLPSTADWAGMNLGVLHLGHNRLKGKIPRTLLLASQSNLAYLDLSYNQFVGPVPTEIGKMSALRVIDAMSNRLTGSLPTEMLNMNMNLRLNFTNNLLTGPIPGMFCGEGAPTSNILYRENGCDAVMCRPGTWNPCGHATLHSCCRACNATPPGEENVLGRINCEGLTYVHGDLDGDGVVSPREILRMIYIDNIGKFWGQAFQNWVDKSVHECDLTGITCSSEKLITKIDLSQANLCASADRQPGPVRFCLGLPSEIGLLTDLESFQASRRQYLRGSIPTEFGRLTNLRLLDLSSCPSMEGTIPSELGRLSNLKYLMLSHGPFQGTIPSNLFHLTDLEKLHLTKNSLKGSLPNIIRTTNLKEFMLSRNDLSGTIPTQLGRLSLLENFEGYGNEFSGTIPTEIGKCQNMKRMDLFNNKLHGNIPTEIAKIQKLQIFHVKGNKLTGTVPKEFGELPTISWFDVSDNKIHGTIPQTFASSRTIKDLRFADNMIYSPIPPDLCENKNINGGATKFGCSGVLCPIGTFADLGFAMENSEGCKPCPKGQSTLYLGSTKCRIFSTYDILSMLFEVMDGHNSWPKYYKETWQNTSVPYCDWEGIRCDHDGEIIGMSLPTNEHAGVHKSKI